MGAPGYGLAFKRAGLDDFCRVGLEIDDGEIASVWTGGAGGMADDGQLLGVAGGGGEDLNGARVRDPKPPSADSFALSIDDVKVGVGIRGWGILPPRYQQAAGPSGHGEPIRQHVREGLSCYGALKFAEAESQGKQKGGDDFRNYFSWDFIWDWARAKTSCNISRVRRPVEVFCWLG